MSLLFLRVKLKNGRDNRFSPSSVYKYKKFHKIKYNFSALKLVVFSSSNLSSFFKIKLFSTAIRLLQSKNLKSVRMFVRKPYTKIISIQTNPYKGFTKKPSEVRMGKGKGSKVAFRAFPMRIGSPIFFVPERIYPNLTYSRTHQKFQVYSNKLNSHLSKIFRGFF